MLAKKHQAGFLSRFGEYGSLKAQVQACKTKLVVGNKAGHHLFLRIHHTEMY